MYLVRTDWGFSVSIGISLFAKLAHGLVHSHVVRQHSVADQEFQFVVRTEINENMNCTRHIRELR